MIGNRAFVGSLVQPLVNSGRSSSTPIPGPITVVGSSESFIMDTKASQVGSIQVNVGKISTAAATATVTQASGVSITTGNLIFATGGTNMWTGDLVRATSGTTLPTGIVAATDYFVYVIDATNGVLFSTLANCLLAQALYNGALPPASATGLIIPSAIGVGTMTLTPTALAGAAFILQGSNDFIPSPNVVGSNVASTGAPTALNAGNWTNITAAEMYSVTNSKSVTTASTSLLLPFGPGISYAYVRALFTVAAGTAQVQVIGHSK